MATQVTRKLQTLRIVVAGSWAVYITTLVVSVPFASEYLIDFLFSVMVSLIGIAAVAASFAETRLWRILGRVAALVYLVGYVTRNGMLIHSYGLTAVLKDSWLIAEYSYKVNGIGNVVAYTFTMFVMPVLQLGIIWLLRASPNPLLQGTRQEAARL